MLTGLIDFYLTVFWSIWFFFMFYKKQGKLISDFVYEQCLITFKRYYQYSIFDSILFNNVNRTL